MTVVSLLDNEQQNNNRRQKCGLTQQEPWHQHGGTGWWTQSANARYHGNDPKMELRASSTIQGY